MNCQTFRDDCIDLILPGGDPERTAALAAHAESCPACAAYLADTKETLGALQPSVEIKASADFKERVMKKIEEMDARTGAKVETARPRRVLPWWQALAAATLLIVGYVAFMNFISRDTGAAWAVEKTLKAYEGLKFIHIKVEPVTADHVNEMWAQFDGKGKLERLRYDFPDTPDGPKVVLWEGDKATVWFKKKNALTTVREPSILERIKMTARDFDPRALVEGAFGNEATSSTSGLGKVGVKLPPAPGPTKVTPEDVVVVRKKTENERAVFHIDPKTNLVSSFEKFRTEGGKEKMVLRMTYLDYNKPEVARAFEPDIPKDVIRVDQTARPIGLEQGSLSEKEIQIKVAREFFEALAAGDYDKAGLLLEGMPGERLKKAFSGGKILRVVSVGEPRPHPNPKTGGVQVPVEVEVEVDGKRGTETFTPGIRQVYNQPGRWDIFGGI